MPSAGYPRGPARSPPCKVVLLGEGRVGKTSLVLRFCKDSFSEAQPPTIQASYLDKQMTIGDKRLSLAIWDIKARSFHASPIYYRDADAALLVYDITDADSFKKVKSWVKELRKWRAAAAAPPARPPTRPPAATAAQPPDRASPPPQVGETCDLDRATSSTSSGSASSRNRRRPTTRRPSARSTPRPRRRTAEGLRTPSAEWRGGCSRRPRWRRG